ncbi:uncharacterized protein EI97DRAFT_437646 [Westerdykella ornata]|uniref:Uncharacterized protein n=1 Tax=Westerdykella ornata TaxID=318751 RepID=A0A6A6J583_WESOR|nr:uncharacterized protein EI97DRAFT_437646 [Westerdykella ornata]KAF2271605.1 hypothetical protein EI97DRAFT_437646 [Westerdykella ornata]
MPTSPRKSAPSTFETTWTDSDATAFDPAALPVSKAPRAWDRKPEKVVRGDGKEKKVWRRYATRSSTTTVAPDDEELDSRARAVKRLQKVKPADMELIPAKPDGRKRAFKGTRYDRRKSVLPRKRTLGRDTVGDETEPVSVDEEAVDGVEGATTEDANSGSESLEKDEQEQPSTPQNLQDEDRTKSSFSVTVEERETQLSPGALERGRQDREEQAQAASDSEAKEDVSPTMPVYSPRKATPRSPGETDSGLEGRMKWRPDGLGEEMEMRQSAESLGKADSNTVQTEAEATDIQDAGLESQEAETPFAQVDLVNDAVEPDNSTGVVPKVAEDENMDLPRSVHSLTTTDLIIPGVSEPQLEPSNGVTVPECSENVVDELSGDKNLGMSEISFPVDAFHTRPILQPGDIELTAQSSDEDVTEASIQTEITRNLDELTAPAPEDTATPIASTEQSELPVEAPATADSASEQPSETPPQEDRQVLPTTSTWQDAMELTSETPEDALATTPVSEDSEVQPEIKAATTALSDDITDGLSLTPSIPVIKAPEKKLLSPPPPPQADFTEETTSTVLLDILDEDTAILHNFLSKAAASKANKAAIITRRTSLQNRRDSDAVRQALASPRKILEDKDPNSPSKLDNDATLDLTQTLTLSMNPEMSGSPLAKQGAVPEEVAVEEGGEAESHSSTTSSRRSTRTRKSRIPPPASSLQIPKNIALRRTEGGEPIVLKRTEAQELGLLTRANTRKNKQGAVSVALRLLKLAQTASGNGSGSASPASAGSGSEEMKNSGTGKKNVRWDETLAYYREHSETIAEAESLATPDELAGDGDEGVPKAVVKKKVRVVKDKEKKEGTTQMQTPRGKRVRNLGGVNGTPAKGLLSQADGLAEGKDAASATAEKEKEKLHRSSKATAGTTRKIKRHPVGSLDSADTATTPISQLPEEAADTTSANSTLTTPAPTTQATALPKERKSRLAAPRKVKLPLPSSLPLISSALPPVPPSVPVPVDGKENQQGRSLGIGIGSGTPKKGIKVVMPAPGAEGLASSVPAPGLGVEGGLARRRVGRRVV